MSLAPTESRIRSSARSGWRRFDGGEGFAQFGELAIHLRAARRVRFRRRTFARALRAEQPVGDGGAGAGQRQIGHRDVRIAHGERERGAGLVAVERAVAGRIGPQRALALPDLQRVRRLAGAAALVAGAARPVILRGRARQIIAEAKAFVGQRDRAVGIAFAGGDAVAEAGDEDVAHRDLGRDALVALGAGDVHRRHRGAAVAHAVVDRLGAIERRALRTVAVVERPGAGGADRNGAGQPHHDRMVDRRQIAFLDAVAGAGLVDAAGEIDAEPVDGVARPAAAVALHSQRLFGGPARCGRASSRHAAEKSRSSRNRRKRLRTSQEIWRGPPTAGCAYAISPGRPASRLASSAAGTSLRKGIRIMALLTLPVRQK